MGFLEDWWQAVTGGLYEHRIAVALAIGVALVVVASTARRRGWLTAARRHPGRTGIATVVALVVGIPLAWYLASPIFIRTVLVEDPPIAAAPIADRQLATPGPSKGAAPTTPPAADSPAPAIAPTSSPEETPFAPTTIASGSFQGTDEFHFGRGTASIIETAPGRYHLRLEDFSVRNGPDLFVYLSPAADGYTKGALELGRLKATDGAFGYDLPAGTDPADYASAIIWCKQFTHLFATAPFVDG